MAIINNCQNKFKNSLEYQDNYVERLMGKTLIYLLNYSQYHFDMEENYMERIEYPDFYLLVISMQIIVKKTVLVLLNGI